MQAINSFCRELGITRADSLVHLHKLDFHVRLGLDPISPRCLAVLHPLRLTLTNLAPDFHTTVAAKVPLMEGCSRGAKIVSLSQTWHLPNC